MRLYDSGRFHNFSANATEQATTPTNPKDERNHSHERRKSR
jgi:hypothetical protein